MTTLRTNTVRYPFATSTADLATNTTLGTATRLTFTAITVTIAETASRTFLSVIARMSFRDRFTVANEITALRMGSKVAAAAYVDVDRTFTQANTGDHLFDEWTLDVTDNFNANFGAGATQTVELGLAVATTAASNIGGSITAELVITYQYDDASGTTRTKTIGIPIQSHHTTLTNVQQEIGTTGGTVNAPANQIPALDTYLPEASKAYKAIYAVSTANDASVAASDVTPFIQIDSAAEVARGLIGQALITTMPWRDIFDLLGAGMTTNAVHAFKMRADVTTRLVFAGAVVWVTYTYDASSTVAIINQALIPLTESNSDAPGLFFGEGFNTTDVQTLYADLDIQEPAPIALVQSAVVVNVSSTSTSNNISIQAGGQAVRTYIPIGAAGEEPLIHRGDHSSGWSLARGRNRLAVKIANTAAAGARSAIPQGYVLITYTSGLPGNGPCAGNRVVNFFNAAYANGALPVAIDVAAASQRTPTLVAPYRLNGVLIEGRVRLNGGSTPPQLLLAQNAGEWDAAGWITAEHTAQTIGELSSWWFMVSYTQAFNRSSFRGGAMSIETGRREVSWGNAANHIAAWSTWVSYHQCTFAVAGTVTISGSPAANGKLVAVWAVNADLSAEVVNIVATAGGAGGFTCQVPDNTRTYFATYNDSGNLGRSIDGTPGSSTFNVTMGGSGSGDTTPPVVTIISPTPGVNPGDPGGFPADWLTARNTPIVLQVTDLAPGLEYVAVIATLPGGVEEVVYRRGAFRGRYVALSSVAAITNGFQFSVRPADGWPPGNITFAVDPLDAAGNLAA